MRALLLPLLLLPLVLLALTRDVLGDDDFARAQNAAHTFFDKHGGASGSGHTNNWAVLVCASRYWFNYRVSTLLQASRSCILTIPRCACSTWRTRSGCAYAHEMGATAALT